MYECLHTFEILHEFFFLLLNNMLHKDEVIFYRVSIGTLGASSCVLFFTPKSSGGAKNSGGPWKRLILIYSSILYGTFFFSWTRNSKKVVQLETNWIQHIEDSILSSVRMTVFRKNKINICLVEHVFVPPDGI